MKKILILSIALGSFALKIKAQTDNCINYVTTNPDNPLNNGCEQSKNEQGNPRFFDWRGNVNFPVNMVNNQNYIPTPFYSNISHSNPEIDYLWDNTRFVTPDYHPQDGWELITSDFGLSQSLNNPVRLIYIVLYNKYTGILRVLFAQNSPDYTYTEVILQYTQTNRAGNLIHYQNIAQPLDMPTEVLQIKSLVTSINNDYAFMGTDFQLAYDPCNCIFNAPFQIIFKNIEQQSFNLVGRSLGINQSVGTGSFNFNSDFLTGFNFENNIKTGTTIQKNINKLIQGYQQASLSRQNLQIMADVFEKFLKVAGGGKSEDGKTVAKFLDFAMIPLKFNLKNAEKKENYYGMSTITTAEMRLSGVSNIANSAGHTAQFNTPGFINNDIEFCNDIRYPLYNEKLGLFAMMETPKVKRYSNVNPKLENIKNISTPFNLTEEFQLDKDLKFIFNDALNINYEKTKIYGALNLHFVNINKVQFPYNHNFQSGYGFDYVYSYDDDVFATPSEAMNVYSSPFMQLNCLSEYKSSYTYNIFSYPTPFGNFPVFPLDPILGKKRKVYLKLYIDLHFNDKGTDGEYKRTALMLTYPVEIVDVENPFNQKRGFRYYDNNTREISDWHHTIQMNHAFPDELLISGNHTTAPGVEVTYYAETGFKVAPDAQISPNINLVIGTPPFCGDEIKPQNLNLEQLRTYCTSNRYSANRTNKKLITYDEPENPINDNVNSVKVYPNPTQSFVNIENLNGNRILHIEISDITGSKVFEQKYFEESNLTLDLSNLKPGVLMVKVKTTQGIETHKLVLMR